MGTPTDLPGLEGNVYLLTFERDDEEPDVFATIQETEQRARQRLHALAIREWGHPVEITDVRRLDGDRGDQLAELVTILEDHEAKVPESVKWEFALFLTSVPADRRRELIERLPDPILAEVKDLLPDE